MLKFTTLLHSESGYPPNKPIGAAFYKASTDELFTVIDGEINFLEGTTPKNPSIAIEEGQKMLETTREELAKNL